jgi:hypothetical protein
MALGLGLCRSLLVRERMLLDSLLAPRCEDDSSRFHGLAPPYSRSSRLFHVGAQFNAAYPASALLATAVADKIACLEPPWLIAWLPLLEIGSIRVEPFWNTRNFLFAVDVSIYERNEKRNRGVQAALEL